MSSAITPPATMNASRVFAPPATIERRARHRPAHRHPLEQAGRDIARALPDEVARGVRRLAVGGGEAAPTPRHPARRRRRRVRRRERAGTPRLRCSAAPARAARGHIDDVIEQQHRGRRARRLSSTASPEPSTTAMTRPSEPTGVEPEEVDQADHQQPDGDRRETPLRDVHEQVEQLRRGGSRPRTRSR